MGNAELCTLCDACYLFNLCCRHTTSFMERGFRHGNTLQPMLSAPMLTCGFMPYQPCSMLEFYKLTR